MELHLLSMIQCKAFNQFSYYSYRGIAFSLPQNLPPETGYVSGDFIIGDPLGSAAFAVLLYASLRTGQR